MIRFQDSRNRIETPDVQLMGFRDIKPSTEITRTEACDYWDDLFSKPIEPREIIRTDIEKMSTEEMRVSSHLT